MILAIGLCVWLLLPSWVLLRSRQCVHVINDALPLGANGALNGTVILRIAGKMDDSLSGDIVNGRS